MHVFRWDLDKTYLQTDFDSVRGLIRAAREPAEAKRNVPGSGALLRALCETPNARVVILSGSPTQMREVLTRKLQLDGIRFDEFHLKDNLENLKRGRFRAIKGQMGYKLPQLLAGRKGLGQAVGETLFGDDAEIDALVYSLFADVMAGRVGRGDLSRILEAGGAYPDQIRDALVALDAVGRADVVRQIFIHLDRRMPPSQFRPLGARVVPVYSWFQASLVLYGSGQLPAPAVVEVAREVLAAGGWPGALSNHFQDIVRRGHLKLADAERLVGELTAAPDPDPQLAPVISESRRKVALLGQVDRYRHPASPPGPIDYVRLLKQLSKAEAG